MSIRHYSNTAPQLTLASSCSPTDTTIATTTSFTGFPAVPFFATLDPDTGSQEVVLVTATVGSSATITRGQDNTVAVGHPAGAVLQHAVVAQDFTEANAHVNATTGVHGLPSGDSPVGVTATQTLTNKTLTNPTINGGATNPASLTVSGASALAALSVSGDLTATGSGALKMARPYLVAQCGTTNQTIYHNETASGSQFYDSNSLLSPVVAADTIGIFVAGTPNTLVMPTGMGGPYRISVNFPWAPNGPGADGANLYVTVTVAGSPVATCQCNAMGPSSAVIAPRIRTIADGQSVELHALVQLTTSAVLFEAVPTQNSRAILLLEKLS